MAQVVQFRSGGDQPQVGASSVAVNPTPQRFAKCFIQPQGSNIRVRWDGQDAGANDVIVFSNGGLTLDNPSDVSNAQMIQDSAATDVVVVLG